jgi:hypothetical protein
VFISPFTNSSKKMRLATILFCTIVCLFIVSVKSDEAAVDSTSVDASVPPSASSEDPASGSDSSQSPQTDDAATDGASESQDSDASLAEEMAAGIHIVDFESD